MTRQGGPKPPSAVPKTRSEINRVAEDEIVPVLETIASNGCHAILGDLDTEAVLEGIVQLAERAARRLRAALIELS